MLGVRRPTTADEAEAGAVDAPPPPFDLLITDENFGDGPSALRGSECVQLLRAAGLRLPVIICSGNAGDGLFSDMLKDAEYVPYLMRMGADACWGKPLPSWSDGTMQRQLASLLRDRTRDGGREEQV